MHNDMLTSSRYSRFRSDTVYACYTTKMRCNVTERVLSNYHKLLSLGGKMFSIEDLWFTAYEGLSVLKVRPLYCTLTHNDGNALGGGATSVVPLSTFGKRVIREMNYLSIALDVSHLNRKSFYSAIPLADRVLCSHTALYSVHKHPRNLLDNQIKLVLSKGGIVGITPVAEFLGKNGTAEDFVRHVDTFVCKFGISGIAIGTDFYGTEPIRKIDNYENLTSYLINALIKLGYTEKQISAILTDNAKKFLCKE